MSEINSNRRYQERFLAGCPLWIKWDEFDKSWQIHLRNTGWCEITKVRICADGKPIKLALSLQAGKSVTVSITDLEAQPSEFYISEVTTADGVVWYNTEGNAGQAVAPAVSPDPSGENYAAFEAAWQGTHPLYQPHFTDTYWRCGCGQVNDIARTFCGKCQRERQWVRDHCNGSAITEYEHRLAEKAAVEEKEKIKQEKAHQAKQHRTKKLFALIAGAVALVLAVTLLISFWFIPARRYAEAQAYLQLDRFYEAYKALDKTSGYRDADQLMIEISRQLSSEKSISGGYRHIVKNNKEGKVFGVGYALDSALLVNKWNSICAVSAGKDHTVGLHYSGTLMAVGNKKTGACNVEGWLNVVQIGAGDGFTIGLKSDGTLLSTGLNDHGQCDVKNWSGIAAISVGEDFVLGLKEDGTVVAVGNNENGQCDVSDWSNVVYVSAGNSHALGVTADGKVLSSGKNDNGACNVEEWSDIIAVTAGDEFTVGLKSDGTLVACGRNELGQTEIAEIKDAIGVVSGWNFTVVIKSDGSTKFLGTNTDGEGNIGAWKVHL